MSYKTIDYDKKNHELILFDQRKLPLEKTYFTAKDYNEFVNYPTIDLAMQLDEKDLNNNAEITSNMYDLNERVNLLTDVLYNIQHDVKSLTL